jgi:hypothetical protein
VLLEHPHGVAAQQIRTELPAVSVLILSQYIEPHYNGVIIG